VILLIIIKIKIFKIFHQDPLVLILLIINKKNYSTNNTIFYMNILNFNNNNNIFLMQILFIIQIKLFLILIILIIIKIKIFITKIILFFIVFYSDTFNYNKN
jgi:hypothetical protein